MGFLDKIRAAKDKADDLVDQACEMIEKVPGCEGVGDTIDADTIDSDTIEEVADHVEELTDKIPGTIPGMGDDEPTE